MLKLITSESPFKSLLISESKSQSEESSVGNDENVILREKNKRPNDYASDRSERKVTWAEVVKGK